MRLSDVAKTAVVTLRCHAVESRKNKPILHDPMAEYCLDRLAEMASAEEKALLFERKLNPALVNHICIRARKYDSIVEEFVARNAGAVVVNLGCGFDTRYWRIAREKCVYFELDLPEVVDLKKSVLRERLEYDLIGGSVLDPAWIDRVTSRAGKNRDVLLLAEGLFMYLPRVEVVELFRTLSEKFESSRVALCVVTEKYTRGFWKKMVERKLRKELGFETVPLYHFGVKNARELETYDPGIKVLGEWSYVEDPDIRPRILKCLGISRTQWTVIVAIN